MEFAYTILAEAADHAGGKLYVMGGDIDSVDAKSFPFVYPQLNVVVKLSHGESADVGEHVISIEIIGPDGIVVEQPRIRFPFTIEHHETRKFKAAIFVFGMSGIRFKIAGDYIIRINVDDGKLTRDMDLKLVQRD